MQDISTHIEDLRQNIIPKIFKFTEETYGESAHAESWDDFSLNGEVEPDHEDESTVFLPWFIFNWKPSSESEVFKEAPRGISPAAAFMAKESAHLTDFEKTYLNNCIKEPFSFYELISKDKGVKVQNLINNKDVIIADDVTQDLNPGDIFFAKIINSGQNNIHLLEGFSPYIMEASAKDNILQIIKESDFAKNELAIIELYHAVTGKFHSDCGCDDSECGDGGCSSGCCGGGEHKH